MRSALLLAEGEPFILGAILSPRFDLSGTCLVTLSACEAGVAGLEVSADEYLGLAAGMLQAGTPAVISTLWAVGDVSTALLMKEFYRRHVGDDQTPAAALRGAQLWMRDATAQQLSLSELWGAVYEASGWRDKTAFVVAPQLPVVRHTCNKNGGPDILLR